MKKQNEKLKTNNNVGAKVAPCQEKGITLVALVITIIVLIILAGVSINAVMNDGLITNAKQAKDMSSKHKILEAIDFYKLELSMEKNGGQDAVEPEEFVADLVEQGLITEEEGTALLNRESIKNGEIELGEEILGKVDVTSVTVTSDYETVGINKELQLIANVLPENASNKTVTWSSSNNAIATVDSTGKVTGKAVGEVTITTTVDGKSNTCTLDVKNIITFSVGDNSYEAEEGMTWEQFVNDNRYNLNETYTINFMGQVKKGEWLVFGRTDDSSIEKEISSNELIDAYDSYRLVKIEF